MIFNTSHDRSWLPPWKPSTVACRVNPFRYVLAILLAACLAVVVTLNAKDKPDKPGRGDAAGEPTAVTFAPAGGAFATNVLLRLSTRDDSAVIHYTLDGSLPGETSPVYRGGLMITNSALVRARAFPRTGGPGKAEAHSYTLLDADVAAFDSNLPLLILHAFGESLTREQRIEGAIQIFDGGESRATFAGAASISTRALLNVRGRASLRYPKSSFSVKMIDADGDPSDVTPFGFPGDSDWVLYAPYPDKALMRDVLAYEWHAAMGYWAPRTKFVEVFVNRTGGKLSRRDYQGVYVFEERIKRGRDRVNIAKLKPGDGEEPAVTGGYIFKKDHTDSAGGPVGGEGYGAGPTQQNTRAGYPTGPGGFPGDPAGFLPAATVTRTYSSSSSSRSRVTPVFTNHLGFAASRLPVMNRDAVYRDEADSLKDEESFRTTRTNQFYFVEPDPNEITPVQKSWLKSHLNQLEAALYGTGFRDPATGYQAYLDVDSFIDYHLLTEISKNVDGFRFSVFYHKDREGKVRADPIWDWNLSLGNANGKQGWLAEYWLWPQLDDKECTWYRRLFEDPDFSQRYVDRFAELRTNVFATKRVLARIDALTALLQEAQKRNFEKWPILGRPINPNYYGFATFDEEIAWLKKFVETRLQWMDQQFVPTPIVSVSGDAMRLALRGPAGPGGSPDAGPGVRAGRIYFTTDGTDPRAPGGDVSKTARGYEADVTLTPGAQVMARARVSSRWSAPVKWGGAGKQGE